MGHRVSVHGTDNCRIGDWVKTEKKGSGGTGRARSKQDPRQNID